ncbi:serine/threonine-protein kinase [Spirosoma rigui]|uniref:serine/threonine-protein kinase n=1 Tax=Spirosoma rigui TaxID=564064 RepID=UPI0009B12DC5|nr:serine/threonine-protein kinase [Spirosoma rigui]
MNQSFTSFSEFKRRYPIRPNDTNALLGSGSYGRVFKVEDQVETEWVAIKISEFKGNDNKSLKAEVELAQRVPRQGNIARYDACFRLETDTSVSDFAIMKYYPDGNLADLLQRVTLTPTQIYDITRGILLGLQHLHRNRIVHRDFKPANILISRDNAQRLIPKIADFGLSKLVTSDELDNSDFDLSDGRGTPSYKAPEQIEGSRVSFNLDLWAFGVILYEIMTGEKPFKADLRNSSEQSARREIEKKIMTVELPSRIHEIAEPYASIIRRCLVRDIHERVRREEELLDLLDEIPQLLVEAKRLAEQHRYPEAVPLFEQILDRREQHAEAEAGLTTCQSALGNQLVNDLLKQANQYVAQKQFKQAKNAFEEVLQLSPTHSDASQGLALCVSRLRPEPVKILQPTTDPTDVFVPGTDLYTPSVPVKPIVAATSNPIANNTRTAPTRPVVASVSDTTKQVIINNPVSTAVTRTIPWRVLAPVALGLGVLVWYVNSRTVPDSTVTGQPTKVASSSIETTEKAGIMPNPFRKETPKIADPTPGTMPASDAIPVPTKTSAPNSVDKRIDIAMDKARLAYERKEYELAIVLCRSAIQLDPTRQDVAAFLTSSSKASQRLAAANTPSVALPKEEKESKTAEPVKPVTPAPDEKDKAQKEKQEAQLAYEQLIDDGMKAIANGNNKAKAIADFSKAGSLAKEHNLSTTRAEGAYATYLTKANRIFDSEEYEGAKAWFKVAQALKDTPEVRTKIKQCTNQ